MPNLPSLVVDVLGRNTGLKRTFREGEQLAQGFANKVVSVLAPLGTALGLGASVQAFRESEKAGKVLEATLKATGGAAGLTATEVKDLASGLQDVTNFEDDATTKAATMLATFKQINGDHFKQAIGFAQDMSTVLETDLKSSVLQIGKALNDPIRGITALTRSGVSFTEQQKQQIKTLQESGDILGAQKVILQELGSEFGGAARAAADPMTQLTNVVGDVGETIGAVLAPAIHSGATRMIQFVKAVTPSAATVDVLGRGVKGVAAILGPFAISLGTVTVAVWGYNKAIGAATALTKLFEATGPGRLAKVALALGTAGAAYLGIQYAIGETESVAASLNREMKALQEVQEDLGGATSLEKTLGDQERAMESYATKAKVLWQRLDDIRRLSEDGAIDAGLAEFLRKGEIDRPGVAKAKAAVHQVSGFDQAMKEAADRVRSLKYKRNVGFDDIDLQAMKFLDAGVDTLLVGGFQKILREEKTLLDQEKADEERLRAEKDRQDAVLRTRESLRSPAEQLRDEANRLRALLGVGGLTDEEFTKAIRQKAAQLLGPESPNDIPEFNRGRVTAVSGSDAMSAILAAQRDAENPQNKIAKNSEMQLKEQQEIKKALNEQLAQLKQTPPVYFASSKP